MEAEKARWQCMLRSEWRYTMPWQIPHAAGLERKGTLCLSWHSEHNLTPVGRELTYSTETDFLLQIICSIYVPIENCPFKLSC